MRNILLFAILSASGSAFSATGGFTGAWGNEDDGYTIIVKDNHACGMWSYIATNHYYNGLFTGTVEGNSLIVNDVCGELGSFANTICPNNDVEAEIETGWSPSQASARICHGRLIFLEHGDLPNECSANPTLGEAPVKGKDGKKRMKELKAEILRNPEFGLCR